MAPHKYQKLLRLTFYSQNVDSIVMIVVTKKVGFVWKEVEAPPQSKMASTPNSIVHHGNSRNQPEMTHHSLLSKIRPSSLYS